MKLIKEAVKQDQLNEMKEAFKSPRIIKEAGMGCEGEEFPSEGVFKTIDDESGRDIYIEWEWNGDEYDVTGLSWEIEGPFVDVKNDYETNWYDWAVGEIEQNKPYRGHDHVKEGFKLKYKPLNEGIEDRHGEYVQYVEDNKDAFTEEELSAFWQANDAFDQAYENGDSSQMHHALEDMLSIVRDKRWELVAKEPKGSYEDSVKADYDKFRGKV
jgi:hypothetical protein